MNTERELLSALENLFEQKRFSDALLLAKKGSHEYPSSFQIKFLYVRILKQLNKLKDAENSLNELMLIYPNNITLLQEAGDLSTLQNKFDEAIDYHNKILFLDPFNSDSKNAIDRINKIKKGGLMEDGKNIDFVSYQSEKLHSADTLPEFDSSKIQSIGEKKIDLPSPPPPPPIPEIEIDEPQEFKVESSVNKEEKTENKLIPEPPPPPSIPEMDTGEWEKKEEFLDIAVDEKNIEKQTSSDWEQIDEGEGSNSNNFDEKSMGIDENVWEQDDDASEEMGDDQELTVMSLEPPNLEPPPEDTLDLKESQQMEYQPETEEIEDEISIINNSRESSELDHLDEITEISDFIASQEIPPEETEKLKENIYEDEEEDFNQGTHIPSEDDQSKNNISESEELMDEVDDVEPLEEEEVSEIPKEAEIVTESAAELYLKQGLLADAQEIFEKLYTTQKEEKFLIKIDQLKHQRKIQKKILLLNELLRVIKQKGEEIV